MDHQAVIHTASELGLRVDTVADIPGLIGAVYSADGLILHGADLGPEVFRLASGVAGELFQTLVNSRIPTAVVVTDFSAYGERFAELASEHSRHSGVRFVHTEAQARAWLATTALR